ncbi:hypothetical protein AAE02nite_43310 [Adhaeribacter aerolatus]|uniref:Uncharacterized protein n=1 Tax=Adhaeribacter aerolatus TaxID=670289 RepID=A0A512B4H3_9BACT|nr:hypothetical protein [Adhaeribacter aerolatus]GEO06667.1 hypothetical protein AAE02nite_43310 [Adhaeribacter aerolatus]
MKRPSTASAGLNFLNQGYTIELSVQGVGAFLRYCERNKPGFELKVSYQNDMAVVMPVKAPVESPSFKASLKATLEKAGIGFENKFFNPGIRSVG